MSGRLSPETVEAMAACIAERDRLTSALKDAERERERLEDAKRDILDIVEGWSRPMSAEEAIETIGKIAREALQESAPQGAEAGE